MIPSGYLLVAPVREVVSAYTGDETVGVSVELSTGKLLLEVGPLLNESIAALVACGEYGRTLGPERNGFSEVVWSNAFNGKSAELP